MWLFKNDFLAIGIFWLNFANSTYDTRYLFDWLTSQLNTRQMFIYSDLKHLINDVCNKINITENLFLIHFYISNTSTNVDKSNNSYHQFVFVSTYPPSPSIQ